ncbi:MAG: hypothetical protein NTW20_03675 [Rhodobacterales bacterium]|nr:hypothetical protein [Rhodobacterales bacterium]
MLNIFAEAMLIATRMGQLPRDVHHTHRRTPREFQDIEGLNTVEKLRNSSR